ncbi:MAG TPA: 50S ribosomal protein L10 [Chitinophagaceae bacterium]|jgi:large subunit ribosomal protein L10|nr:50S ribosomal protein L10 [Chitinophagaceae bacterium]
MTKDQKNEVIVLLKEKFNQYNNFYITDTESLSVEQISNLRRTCFSKQVEMKVAKNTLIRKALESLDSEKYAGLFDSLNNVTALMFSENPKDPAVIISAFRKVNNGDRPTLKAAFINGDIFVGDNSLVALTNIKTKNELIGEVIGLLQSPAKRVIAALLNHAENGSTKTETEVVAAAVEVAVEEVAAPVAEAAPAEAPVAEAPAAEAAPEAAAE